MQKKISSSSSENHIKNYIPIFRFVLEHVGKCLSDETCSKRDKIVF